MVFVDLRSRVASSDLVRMTSSLSSISVDASKRGWRRRPRVTGTGPIERTACARRDHGSPDDDTRRIARIVWRALEEVPAASWQCDGERVVAAQPYRTVRRQSRYDAPWRTLARQRWSQCSASLGQPRAINRALYKLPLCEVHFADGPT